MSWDATLHAVSEVSMCRECGQSLDPHRKERAEAGWWNYTHNTNAMIAAAYEAVTGEQTGQCEGPLGPAIGAAWWKRLDGASGPDGVACLSAIIQGLEADPGRFRAMNPGNGWGDYDGLLKVLREMRDAPEEDGTYEWQVSG